MSPLCWRVSPSLLPPSHSLHVALNQSALRPPSRVMLRAATTPSPQCSPLLGSAPAVRMTSQASRWWRLPRSTSRLMQHRAPTTLPCTSFHVPAPFIDSSTARSHRMRCSTSPTSPRVTANEVCWAWRSLPMVRRPTSTTPIPRVTPPLRHSQWMSTEHSTANRCARC